MDISNTEILRKLQTMRGQIAAHTFVIQAKRLKLLAAKAGFRPNQPRMPAGHPDGGQWVNEGLPARPIKLRAFGWPATIPNCLQMFPNGNRLP